MVGSLFLALTVFRSYAFEDKIVSGADTASLSGRFLDSGDADEAAKNDGTTNENSGAELFAWNEQHGLDHTHQGDQEAEAGQCIDTVDLNQAVPNGESGGGDDG